MAEYLDAFITWLTELGEKHGVNPLVLGILYLCSKVTFFSCLGWTVKNLRNKKPFVTSLTCAGAAFSVPYLYIIIAGHDISVWMYVFIICLFLFGGYNAWRQISKQTKQVDI